MKIISFVLIALVLTVGVAPVIAQSSTAEPTAPAETPVVVVESNRNILEAVVSFFAGAVVATAATLTAALRVVANLSKNQPTLDFIEQLTKSWPPETREVLLELGKVTQEAGKVIETVSDGLPNVPPEPEATGQG